MHIYDRLFFWVILGIVGAMIIGFVVSYYYGGEAGGASAAIWMLSVAVAAGIYIWWYQRKNP